MNQQELAASLRDIPYDGSPTATRTLHRRVAHVLSQAPNRALLKEDLEQLLDSERPSAEVDVAPDDLYFKAFFALQSMLREARTLSDYVDLERREDASLARYHHYLVAIYRAYAALWSDDYDEAARQAEQAVRDAADDIGVLNTYGRVVAQMCEASDAIGERPASELGKAARWMTKAIKSDPDDDVFYETRGRLRLLMGDFESARHDFEAAIQHVSLADWNYAERIARYEGWLSRLDAREIKESIKELRQDAERFRLSTVELLAVLAAVIALVITGTQVALQSDMRTPKEIAQIMAGVGGTVLAIFASFVAMSGVRGFRLRVSVFVALAAVGAVAWSAEVF